MALNKGIGITYCGHSTFKIASAKGKALIIDPWLSSNPVCPASLKQTDRLDLMLVTHGHFDHIGAAAEFCGDDLPFYIHQADAMALTDPEAWGAGFATPPVPVKDVRTVAEGEEVAFAGFRIEVLHTPGHTPGSVCFRTDGWVLSGDLVFAGAIGRSDFPNSSPADMDRSLRRFLELPDPLDVLPGHGPRTTVGRERTRNPFLVELR